MPQEKTSTHSSDSHLIPRVTSHDPGAESSAVRKWVLVAIQNVRRALKKKKKNLLQTVNAAGDDSEYVPQRS